MELERNGLEGAEKGWNLRHLLICPIVKPSSNSVCSRETKSVGFAIVPLRRAHALPISCIAWALCSLSQLFSFAIQLREIPQRLFPFSLGMTFFPSYQSE